MKLSSKDKSYLKGLAHHLKPILQIGKGGVEANFIENMEATLESHELIKIKVLESSSDDKEVLVQKIEKATGGHVVQIIGKTLLYYRPFRKDPQITLPLRP